ncbi:hypothetical protein pb186bvf_010856 [Paramecium bursaria]
MLLISQSNNTQQQLFYFPTRIFNDQESHIQIIMFMLIILFLITTSTASSGHGSSIETFDHQSDLLEHMTWTPSGWADGIGNPLTSIYTCSESKVGPYLGGFTSSFYKSYSLNPHFYMQISIDVLFTQFWDVGDELNIYIDGNNVYSDNNLRTSLFNGPYTYCTDNTHDSANLNQKIQTIYIELPHQNPSFQIGFSGFGNCHFQTTQNVCSMVAIKNLVIEFSKCHQSCLTCSGADKMDCLSCPSGQPVIGGTCSCSNLGKVIFRNQCVSQCNTFYSPVNGECTLTCPSLCKTCNGSICLTCIAGILISGTCQISCPSWAPGCVDYASLSSFGSSYLKTPSLTNLDIYPVKQFFSYSGSSQSGQWSGNGPSQTRFTFSYSQLSPHYNVRLYFTAYFIDNWSGQSLTVSIDNNIVTTYTTPGSATASANTMYRGQGDLITVISSSASHSSSTLSIKLQINQYSSAFVASLGITDLYVLTDNCSTNCETCTAFYCTSCIAGATYITGRCLICGPQNNRDTSCSCLTNFYDDGVTSSCVSCPQQCIGCTSVNNCNACAIHYNTLPTCLFCDDGYFYQGGICVQCDTSCLTCSNSNSCILCQPNQIHLQSGLCSFCGQGYYSVSDICIKCDKKCSSCIGTPTNCQACATNRGGPSLCNCSNGYYEDNSSNCQACSFKCSQCVNNPQNCLVCGGNRLYTPSCECGPNSISINNQAYCSNCDITVAIIRFSNDLSQILVNLNKNINTDYDCINLISDTSKLGINPTCQISESFIIIDLGDDSTININDVIQFTNLRLENCQGYTMILNNYVQAPINYIQPSVIFQDNNYQLIYCTEYYVSIKSRLYDGKRKYTNFYWSSYNTSALGLLLQWNQKLIDETHFKIPNGFFSIGDTITLTITIQNFLGQIGQSDFNFKVVNDSRIEIILPQNPYSYLQNTVIVNFYEGSCKNIDNQFLVQGTIKNDTYNQTFLGNLTQNQFYLQIQPDILEQGQMYLISANIFDLNISANSKLFVIQKQNYLQILNGNRQIGYMQNIQIFADSSLNSSYKWSCLNILIQQPCKIQSNDSKVFILPAYAFKGYETIQITVKQGNLTSSILVQVIEVLPNKLIRINNYYDWLQFQLTYPTQLPYDQPYYTVQINWGTNQTIFNIYYNQFKFRLCDKIPQYNFDLILVKVSIFDPDNFTPSLASQKIRMNIPPQNCLVYQEIDEFTINNCKDENIPILYLFAYYVNKQEYKNDNDNGFIFKGIILQDFSPINRIKFYVPFNDSFILILAKNNFQAIQNYTINVQMSLSQINESIFISNQSKNQLYIWIINSLLFNISITDLQIKKIQLELTYNQQMQIQMLQRQYPNKTDLDFQYQQLSEQITQATETYKKLFHFTNYLDEFNKLQQRAQITRLSNYLSLLYKNMVDHKSLRRFLYQTNSTTQLLTEIQDALSSGLQINEPKEQIITDMFNITTSFISQTFFDDTIKSYDKYKQGLQEYLINPFQNDSNFQFNQNKQSKLYIPTLYVNETKIQNKTMNFSFNLPRNLAAQQCASKKDNYWSTEICKALTENQILKCLCSQLSPTTIVDILINIQNTITNVFTEEAFNKIQNIQFQYLVFFYIIATYTLIYLILIYFCNKWDIQVITPQLINSQIHPIVEQYSQNDMKTIKIKEQKQYQNFYKVDEIQKLKHNDDENQQINNNITAKIIPLETPTEKNQDKEIIDLRQSSTSSPISERMQQEEKKLENQGLLKKVHIGQMSNLSAFYIYAKYWHQLFGLYYRYDQQSSRIHRLTIIYISLLGQICIMTVFGKILGLSTLLVLALLQSVFGLIYSKSISYLLNHDKKFLKQTGGALIILSVFVFYYLILASIALYEDETTANIWAAEYVASFIMDYFVNRIVGLGFNYAFIIHFHSNLKIKRLAAIILDDKMIEFLLGHNQ